MLCGRSYRLINPLSTTDILTSRVTDIEYLLHESECDIAKYFMRMLLYFQEPEGNENKA